ncbi:MAG: hypothetical protein M3P38_06715 [Chloroflexota bacterium]|nr:hypothetical protein [Chloroflexota bacterium]
MRAVLLGALLVTACVPPSSTPATPTPSSPVTFSATPTSAATQSGVPTSTFGDGAAARWPVVLYEGEGFIVSQRTESAKTEIARPCGPVSRLEARPAGLLTWCNVGQSDFAELRLISIPDGRVTVLASSTRASWPADVSPDGRSVAAFRAGECVPGPPVCQTRAVLIDVASKTERELLPSGYPLGATVEWNALGLTLFQPECAEAGCAGPSDRSGTFVWDGSAFKKWGDLRFVAKSGEWTLLEQLHAFYVEPRAVIVRGPQGEKALSAGHALAIASNGETLVWRPGDSSAQRGMLLRFAPDGRVLWQSELVGSVLKMIGPDAFLSVSPENKIELYDLKRMLRFTPTTPIKHVVAGVGR